MLNTAEIQVNAIIAELRAQRDAFGDRAANLAVELSVMKAEKELLDGRLRSLQEQAEQVESVNCEGQN